MRLSCLAPRRRAGWTYLLLATLLFSAAAVPALAQTVTRQCNHGDERSLLGLA